nr:hypothetical protein [uncultured Oscillibacter sp.]
MKKKVVWLCGLWCVCLLLAGCGGKSVTTGWYLRSESGVSLIVTDGGEPIAISDQSEGGDLFDGLTGGDRIQITHDGISETWPGQTGAYSCKLLEEGTMDDIPADTLTALEDMGWDFGSHDHQPANQPQTVEDPVSGWCGNTSATVYADGQEYTLWGNDAIALTDVLINLSYDPDQVCRCMTEFTVDTEFGTGYGVNLTESFARCDAGQASLTADQTETIRDILDRNCGG